MAATYVGSVSAVADNSTGAASPITLDPSPLTMQAGDLVVVHAAKRTASLTYSNSTTGGQVWKQNTNRSTTNLSSCTFYCTFNGTWAAPPQFARSGADTTTPFDGTLHVWRGPYGANTTWLIDVAEAFATYTATGTTKSITGQTTVNTPSVTFAAWMATAAITWGTLSGSGWTVTGGAQYRDTSGSGLSLSYAHYLPSSAGATGNVSKIESVATAGGSHIVTFYAVPYVLPTITKIGSGSGTTGNLNTGSKTPSANKLQLVYIFETNQAGNSTIPTMPSSPSGNSITWGTKPDGVTDLTTTVVGGDLFGFRATILFGWSASPTTGAFTATLGSANEFGWEWYEVDVVDLPSAIGIFGINSDPSTASLSVSLTGLGFHSAAIGFFGTEVSSQDPRASWTESDEFVTAGGSLDLQVQFNALGDTTASSTTTFSGAGVYTGIALELRVPVLFDPFGVSGMFGV